MGWLQRRAISHDRRSMIFDGLQYRVPATIVRCCGNNIFSEVVKMGRLLEVVTPPHKAPAIEFSHARVRSCRVSLPRFVQVEPRGDVRRC
jgi:hypothetical protein